MATRNLVPRGNNEGSLGIDGQRWSALHVASISTDTLKVTNIQLKANDNLPLFVKGPGIADISTNNDGQFVIQVDDNLLEDLGFSTETGLNPGFTRDDGSELDGDDTISPNDSLKTAIQKLNDDLRGVAVPTTLTVANFNPAAILASGEVFVDDDNHLMTAAAVNDRIESFGFGDISAVIAGEGLSGGGNTGEVTLTIPDQNDGANGGFDAGQFGSSSAIPQITVNQKGIITGITTQNVATSLTITGDNDVNDTIDLLTDTLDIEGGAGISTLVSDNKVSISLSSNTVTLGGVEVALGGSDATPAFDLSDATNLPTTSLVGNITNDQLAGAIANAKLANSTVSFGGVSVALGGSDATPAFDLSDATNLPTTSLTGNILFTQIDADAIQTGAEVTAGGGAAGFNDNETSLLTAGAIKRYIDAQGFGVGNGDITQVNITAGTGLDGTVNTEAGAHTQTLDLSDTAVTPGNYGSATQVSTFSVDQQGRLTAAANANIEIASAAITDFSESVQDLVGAQLVTNGSHTGISAAYDDAGDGAIDLTVSAGTAHIQDDAITAAKLNDNVISGQGELAAGLAETDELLISDSDSGTIKKMDVSVLKSFLDRGGDGELDFTVNTDEDVSKANLSSRLASFTGNDTLNIGDADNDTNVVIRGNLTVQGTQTTVDSTAINIQNAFIFEGATDDNNETTLTTVDPTADRTIRLPDQDGYLPVLAAESTTQITSTPEEINLLDGSSAGNINNSKAVIYSETGAVVASSFTGPLVGDVTGNVSGNAGTATILANARDIGGVSFNGSANIDLPGVNIAGNQNTSGNAATATDATNIIATANNDADETVYLTFVDGATGSQGIETDTGLTYNPSTGLLTSTSFSGSLTGNVTGNADTATELSTARTIGMTGDVVWTSAGFDGSGNVTGTATIQDNAITGAKINIISDGAITNAKLAGSIADGKLAQDYVQITEVDDSSIEWDGDGGHLQVKALGITNDMLAGAIANDKLAQDYIQTSEVDDSSIEFVGGSLNVKAAGVTNDMLAGAIANAKLANSSISLGGVSVALGGSDATPAFNLADATNLPTTSLTGTITNDQLAGAIPNAKLANSSVSFGGVSVALGGSDDTPAFNLADATNLPTTSLTGTITNAQLAGAITNAKLVNSTVSFGGVAVSLGGSDATPAFDLSDATNLPTTSLTGTITNAQLAGAITNAKLVNSSVSFGGVEVVLGESDDTPAFNLADATNLPTTSLTGTITNDQLAGEIANTKLANSTVSFGGVSVALGGSDDTPAFDLSESTGYPISSLAGTRAEGSGVTDTQIQEDYIKVSEVDDISVEVNVDGDLQVKDSGVTLSKLADLGNMKVIGNTSGNLATPSAIDIKDEDDMASDSDTALATQQSIKKFVENKLGRHGGMFKTSEDVNEYDGVNNTINKDVEFSGSPIIRSHFGPFAFSLNDLHTLGGSDIIFYGSTSTVASDRHFEVLYDSDANDYHTVFTGANSNTP